MTKRARRRHGPKRLQRPIVVAGPQIQCLTCGRYHVKSEACWFCEPPWPDRCGCDDLHCWHRHLNHELLQRLSQLDYESIDESILLPTENWPLNDGDVVDHEYEDLVGIANRGETHPAPMQFRPQRISWKEAPEYKAFLARYPDLRNRSRQGIDSIFGFFNLTGSEADAWSLDAAGHTSEWIALQLKLRPGGVARLLESVRSKVAAKLARLDALSQRAG